jgi:hypothetical protein
VVQKAATNAEVELVESWHFDEIAAQYETKAGANTVKAFSALVAKWFTGFAHSVRDRSGAAGAPLRVGVGVAWWREPFRPQQNMSKNTYQANEKVGARHIAL